MNKLRLSEAKEEIGVPEISPYCGSDSRLVQLINEATRRLLKRGKWVGSYMRYRINAEDGYITWPRQIETIEAFTYCKTPGIIRNDWYEFLGGGPGLMTSSDNLYRTLIDRGTAPMHDDITGGVVNRKLRVYADVEEDADQVINFRGFDENGNWIRTEVSGAWIDGENVAIPTNPASPVLSANFFTSVTSVQKPVTNGSLRVYEYNNTTAANVKQVAYYEPGEKNPAYRRSLIPGLLNMAECCEVRQVDVQAMLRFIPVVNDNDWIMLGDLDALKLACQAVVRERAGLQGEAEGYWGKAVRELQLALSRYLGDSAVAVPRVQSRHEFGAGITALI